MQKTKRGIEKCGDAHHWSWALPGLISSSALPWCQYLIHGVGSRSFLSFVYSFCVHFITVVALLICTSAARHRLFSLILPTLWGFLCYSWNSWFSPGVFPTIFTTSFSFLLISLLLAWSQPIGVQQHNVVGTVSETTRKQEAREILRKVSLSLSLLHFCACTARKHNRAQKDELDKTTSGWFWPYTVVEMSINVYSLTY